ncbi:MAG: hypothetical protein NTW75_14170 [Planctomycetales bacterium]|nr:hypothetical protein [Planctomycetales bacterium]
MPAISQERMKESLPSLPEKLGGVSRIPTPIRLTAPEKTMSVGGQRTQAQQDGLPTPADTAGLHGATWGV